MTYKSGVVYDGQWVNGHQHDDGKLASPAGLVYVGSFRQNLKHGQGTFTFADDNSYVGITT